MLLLGWLKEHGGFHPFLVGVCLDHLGFDVFFMEHVLFGTPSCLSPCPSGSQPGPRPRVSFYETYEAIASAPWWRPCRKCPGTHVNRQQMPNFSSFSTKIMGRSWSQVALIIGVWTYVPFFWKPKICLNKPTNSGGVPEKPEWICTASHRKRICLEVVVLKSSGNFSMLMTSWNLNEAAGNGTFGGFQNKLYIAGWRSSIRW